jgi:protocatechuate 3,4-dioxygenase beta subunit
MTEPSEHDLSSRISRRRALAWLGGIGLAALAPACGGDRSSSSSTTTTSSTDGQAAGSQTAADCVLMPELTEGPYYSYLDRVRSDITEGRPGLALDLRVNVVDASSCEPVKDAAVDIWHCDAGGEYSGVSGAGQESTTGLTFLRGIQMTDADGTTSFRTIYPGWYAGRAVHIHVKVHLGTDETHTGQLFFDESVTDAVYQTEPYAARGAPETRNENDDIFRQSGGTTIVAVTPGDEAYSGLVTLGVERV